MAEYQTGDVERDECARALPRIRRMRRSISGDATTARGRLDASSAIWKKWLQGERGFFYLWPWATELSHRFRGPTALG